MAQLGQVVAGAASHLVQDVGLATKDELIPGLQRAGLTIERTPATTRRTTPDDFSALFPVEVITQMLGVPAELRQQVRLLLDKTLEREYGKIEMPEAGIAAAVETGMMYFNIIQERRAQPQDDMISDLIAAEVDRGDGQMTRLDDVEITAFASMLGGAGADL